MKKQGLMRAFTGLCLWSLLWLVLLSAPIQAAPWGWQLRLIAPESLAKTQRFNLELQLEGSFAAEQASLHLSFDTAKLQFVEAYKDTLNFEAKADATGVELHMNAIPETEEGKPHRLYLIFETKEVGGVEIIADQVQFLDSGEDLPSSIGARCYVDILPELAGDARGATVEREPSEKLVTQPAHTAEGGLLSSEERSEKSNLSQASPSASERPQATQNASPKELEGKVSSEQYGQSASPSPETPTSSQAYIRWIFLGTLAILGLAAFIYLIKRILRRP